MQNMDTRIARDAACEIVGSAGSRGLPATSAARLERRGERHPVVTSDDAVGSVDEPSILWKLAQVLGRVLTSCLFDLKVYGLENVPKRGGVLLVANHQSYLDPLLIGVRVSRPLSYVCKSELFSNRHFGRFLTFLNAFPLRQGAGDIGAIKETIARVKEGRALALFPEGSRTPNGQMLPILGGVGLIVRRAQVPVVPVAIEGAFAAWPLFKSMFRRWRIHVVYGPPMDLSGVKGEEIVRQIENTLNVMFENLKDMNRREERWS
jgi:1-acyl-sn-glycerol-3-phosphate acyltransferase